MGGGGGPGAQLSHCWSWLPDLLTLFGTLGRASEQFSLRRELEAERCHCSPHPHSAPVQGKLKVEGTSRAGIWAVGWDEARDLGKPAASSDLG